MIDVVYDLFNAFGIRTKPGRLMLPKLIKISEKIFNEILSTVTEAKNNGYNTSLRNSVLFVLAWVAWVACLRGWRASVGGVGGVLMWVMC